MIIAHAHAMKQLKKLPYGEAVYPVALRRTNRIANEEQL
jgi:hypothetical protein